MKIILFFITLFSVQACMARPTVPVSHSHNGRVHQHSLPANGLSHRHGNGAQGQSVSSQNNRGGTISSSVKYPTSRPPKQQMPSFGAAPSNNGFLVLGHIKPSPNSNAPLNFTKGDVNCRIGDADCNVCVSNMRQQFQRASSGKISWQSRPWHFKWPQKYPPYGLRPLDIFNGDPAYALGIPDTHVQGFVRTNSSRFPFAGSHSHKRKGGIFVVQQNNNGSLSLASLKQTTGRHPSAVHVLGKYLVYAEGSQLIFKNLNTPNNTHDYHLRINQPLFGGGLGLTRLSKDNYLLVTTGPGGQKSRPRFNHFYHLKFANGRPASLKFLSRSTSTVPRHWPRGTSFSENLSILTECGTGNIYSVHTSGDEKGVSAIRGNGYWRLSRLQSQGGKLSLNPQDAFSTRQNMSSCNIRAAATVFASRQHKLKFYCHGYAKDPDGSLFNVLGSSSRNEDYFKFKTGTVY